MDFFVNGEKLDITLQDEKTVGDVLKAFEEECQKINFDYNKLKYR